MHRTQMSSARRSSLRDDASRKRWSTTFRITTRPVLQLLLLLMVTVRRQGDGYCWAFTVPYSGIVSRPTVSLFGVSNDRSEVAASSSSSSSNTEEMVVSTSKEKQSPSISSSTNTYTSSSSSKKKKKKKKNKGSVNKSASVGTGFNVVLTHLQADFDTLASAVGLAKLWSLPSNNSTEPLLPTYVVLPRGAHPAVQRFLALHEHLFPIRSLRSLPPLSSLQRLGLVDAQRRDRVGPAEPLLSHASRVTIVDHHVDAESDIPEATDYIVDRTGSVSTMMVEFLESANATLTEAEATLLALGIHSDTGSLTYEGTTARDARSLAWVMERGASQNAIAEHSRGSLSREQQSVLTQALLHTNSTIVHGVRLSTVLLTAEGFINGLAAVTQDVLELSGSDVLLLAVVYDPSNKKKKMKPSPLRANTPEASPAPALTSHTSTSSKAVMNTLLSTPSESNNDTTPLHEGWKAGEEAIKLQRWRTAFDQRDTDHSGFLETKEIASVLASSGVVANKEAIDAVMETLDTNDDGKVDFEEFVTFATVFEQSQHSLKPKRSSSTMVIIGRCKAGVNLKDIHLNSLFAPFGGGGHPKAASATVRLEDRNDAEMILESMVTELIDTSLSKQITVGDFMTAPVLSASPDMTEKQVEDLFKKYDVRALPVVNSENDVVGLVTYKEVLAAKQRLWNKEQKRSKLKEHLAQQQRDGDHDDDSIRYQQKLLQQQQSLSSALKGWMLQHMRVVDASSTMAEAEVVLLDNDVGCMPVVADGTRQLVGMVTRTDLLRQHRYYSFLHYHNKGFADSLESRQSLVKLRKYLKRFDKD